MITGKSKTNKSYKYGVQCANEDFAAGIPRRITYMERWKMREAGVVFAYRPWIQPKGFYASEMERGYQEQADLLGMPKQTGVITQ